MQTRQSRRRNGYNQTRNGVPYYRRSIPLEMREKFGGKREFLRCLRSVSYEAADAEYEAAARGETVRVQPVGPVPDLYAMDFAGLRQLAETGGDVLGRGRGLAFGGALCRRHAAFSRRTQNYCFGQAPPQRWQNSTGTRRSAFERGLISNPASKAVTLAEEGLRSGNEAFDRPFEASAQTQQLHSRPPNDRVRPSPSQPRRQNGAVSPVSDLRVIR